MGEKGRNNIRRDGRVAEDTRRDVTVLINGCSASVFKLGERKICERGMPSLETHC